MKFVTIVHPRQLKVGALLRFKEENGNANYRINAVFSSAREYRIGNLPSGGIQFNLTYDSIQRAFHVDCLPTQGNINIYDESEKL